MNAINAQSIADYLVDLIEQDDQPWSDDGDKPTVRSFGGAEDQTGISGHDPSVLDGQEFQISVVKSR